MHTNTPPLQPKIIESPIFAPPFNLAPKFFSLISSFPASQVIYKADASLSELTLDFQVPIKFMEISRPTGYMVASVMTVFLEVSRTTFYMVSLAMTVLMGTVATIPFMGKTELTRS